MKQLSRTTTGTDFQKSVDGGMWCGAHRKMSAAYPWLYQKLACPLLHLSPVMFEHFCVFTPTKASTALRDSGFVIAPEQEQQTERVDYYSWSLFRVVPSSPSSPPPFPRAPIAGPLEVC
jgi:hypothetical protein